MMCWQRRGACMARQVSGNPEAAGMSGIGKTALAVHAVHKLPEQPADGQILSTAQSHTPGQQPA
jgi:hypothetical protein